MTMQQHPELTRFRLTGFPAQSRIAERRYPRHVPVDLSVFTAPGRIPYSHAVKGRYRRASIGEKFGPLWSTHWFKVGIRIPSDWKGAIKVDGHLTVRNSLLRDNAASASVNCSGGAIYEGKQGSAGIVQIDNCTIAGNFVGVTAAASTYGTGDHAGLLPIAASGQLDRLFQQQRYLHCVQLLGSRGHLLELRQ